VVKLHLFVFLTEFIGYFSTQPSFVPRPRTAPAGRSRGSPHESFSLHFLCRGAFAARAGLAKNRLHESPVFLSSSKAALQIMNTCVFSLIPYNKKILVKGRKRRIEKKKLWLSPFA
jgi:hypothetical protein